MQFTEFYSEHLITYEDFENLTELFLDRLITAEVAAWAKK